MKPNPVAWFEIYVQDMSRAKVFYETVFQSELTRMTPPNPDAFGEMEMLTFPSSMSDYGAAGALVKMPGCPSGGSTLVYFACDDCGVEAARAVAAGGSLFKPKISIGEHGWIALVRDTEGNLLGLHSMH